MSVTFADGWREDQVQAEIMNLIHLQKQKEVIQMLEPKFNKDGNQWCVIWGQMPEKYIAGFGDTLNQAISDFYNSYLTAKP